MIDTFALATIWRYVAGSFNSPLRYWSFGFGLMLLAVLVAVGLRLVGVAAKRHWVTLVFLGIWAVFVHTMAASNPDVRIANYNFANPQTSETGETVLAANPLIWLSDDATSIIVDNLAILEPMSLNRHARVRNHLCSQPQAESWRDWNLSQRKGQLARNQLCGTG